MITHENSLILLDDVNAAELVFGLPKLGQLAQALSSFCNLRRASLKLASKLWRRIETCNKRLYIFKAKSY